MSNRLYVASKYVVEYEGSKFGGQEINFFKLMKEIGVPILSSDDFDPYPSRFDILDVELVAGIDNLTKEMYDQNPLSDYSYEEFISEMKDLYHEADKNSGLIRFFWL